MEEVTVKGLSGGGQHGRRNAVHGLKQVRFAVDLSCHLPVLTQIVGITRDEAFLPIL
jgi:hypothetical protein